ncbi:PCC domain-containing protein, partial [Candidatus Omnitrophota bacterium]
MKNLLTLLITFSVLIQSTGASYLPRAQGPALRPIATSLSDADPNARQKEGLSAAADELAVHTERKDEILRGLTADQKREVKHKAVKILQGQIVQAPKEEFGVHFKNYVIRLKILCIFDILDGLVVYPFTGLDIFLAQFCKTLALNSKDSRDSLYRDMKEKSDLYRNAGVNVEQILNGRGLYYKIYDLIFDPEKIQEAGALANSHKDPNNSHTTLILKGADYIKGGIAPSVGVNTDVIFEKFLSPLTEKMLDSGDHIVLFDADMKYSRHFIDTGAYEEVRLDIDYDKTMSPQLFDSSKPSYQPGISPDSIFIGANFIVLKKKTAVEATRIFASPTHEMARSGMRGDVVQEIMPDDEVIDWDVASPLEYGITQVGREATFTATEGEDLSVSLKKFLAGKGIKQGYFVAEGGQLKDVTLNFFVTEDKRFWEMHLPGRWEVEYLTATIVGGVPHIHCQIRDPETGARYGAHLDSATVVHLRGKVTELVGNEIRRAKDRDTMVSHMRFSPPDEESALKPGDRIVFTVKPGEDMVDRLRELLLEKGVTEAKFNVAVGNMLSVQPERGNAVEPAHGHGFELTSIGEEEFTVQARRPLFLTMGFVDTNGNTHEDATKHVTAKELIEGCIEVTATKSASARIEEIARNWRNLYETDSLVRHAERVTGLAAGIGSDSELDLIQAELRLLNYGSLFHDIGIMGATDLLDPVIAFMKKHEIPYRDTHLARYFQEQGVVITEEVIASFPNRIMEMLEANEYPFNGHKEEIREAIAMRYIHGYLSWVKLQERAPILADAYPDLRYLIIYHSLPHCLPDDISPRIRLLTEILKAADVIEVVNNMERAQAGNYGMHIKESCRQQALEGLEFEKEHSHIREEVFDICARTIFSDNVEFKRALLATRAIPGSEPEHDWPEADRQFLLKQDALSPKPSSAGQARGGIDKPLYGKIGRKLATVGYAGKMWEFLGLLYGHARRDVQIEVINKCPLNCWDCLAWCKMKNSPLRQIPKGKLKSILRSLEGTRKICLTGGEPFLYYNTMKALVAGEVSDDFVEIVNFASECADEVVVDTCGISIPSDPKKAAAFFKRFRKNVSFEISVDKEHADALEKVSKGRKNLKDIVEQCELERDRGRGIRYNVRTRGMVLEGEFNKIIKPWDYKGRLARIYKKIEADDVYELEKDYVIKLSRVKLQSNAVGDFDDYEWFSRYPDPNISYTMMDMGNFLDHIFPERTFLFIGSDLEMLFDAHSCFMPTPPVVARLGSLKDKGLAEAVLDGAIGRLVNFDEFPFLKTLYLAKFFHYTGDSAISKACLKDAQKRGADYEEAYSELTEGWGDEPGVTFQDIVCADQPCYQRHHFDQPYTFGQHFALAAAANLLSHDTIPWLREPLPYDIPTIWNC